MILTNKNQKKIVKYLKELIKNFVQNVNRTEESNTFVPYFDTCLKEDDKKYLQEVKLSPLVNDLVKMQTIRNLMKKETAISTNKLLKVVPNKSDKSEIFSDLQISAIIDYLPNMYKGMDWQLVYSLNRDGIST